MSHSLTRMEQASRTTSWLTVAEAAARYGVTARTIHRHIHAGTLKADKRPFPKRIRVRILRETGDQWAWGEVRGD